MSPYLEEIRKAIRAVHGCDSTFVKSTEVYDSFQGKPAWIGTVETFALIEHPAARTAYAWGYRDNGASPWEITTVLELPPVDSPQTAVKIAIAAHVRAK